MSTIDGISTDFPYVIAFLDPFANAVRRRRTMYRG
jgi:hypothetical protein